MRKILIVSSKNLLTKPFEGAQKRILDIAKFLSKKNKVDIAFIKENSQTKKKHLNFCNETIVFNINFLSRIMNTLLSILKLKPFQNGYFFSKEMNIFLSENKEKYDVIIFHLLRSAQYLPNDFRGIKILEMTDLGSVNYEQIIKEISVLNPFKYLYILEKILLRLYEKKISNLFDKVVFISDKEIHIAKKIIENKKISIITNAFKAQKKIFKHKKSNYKILFVGNINYFPNKLACYNFSRKIMPILRENYPNIEFNIVGKINPLDKFLLSRFQNVKVHGPLDNIEKIVKNSICGICNLKVATGLQMKIFTYLGCGLPVIASQKSFPKKILIKNKQIIVYKDDEGLISSIDKLVKNKKVANRISKNGFSLLKIKFNSSKVYGNYLKILE